MALPQIIMTGTVVDEVPNLRFTGSGVPVVQFRVACNKRVQDPTTKQWRDAEVCFLNVEAWRNRAENIGETLRRGVTVTVIGQLRERTFETKDGQKARVYEVIEANVSVDLANQVAQVEKRGNGGNGGDGGGQRQAAAPAAKAAAPAAPAAPAVGGAQPAFEEPPF